MLDYFSNDSETVFKKNEKKKKLHELLNKYGSVEEIEKNAIGADGYEYMFANTNNLIDEVLKERRSEQSSLSDIRQETPQKRNTLLPEDDDFSLDGLTLSDQQRKAIKNLDTTNQLTIIRHLREEQGVSPSNVKPQALKNELCQRNNTGNTASLREPTETSSRKEAEEALKKKPTKEKKPLLEEMDEKKKTVREGTLSTESLQSNGVCLRNNTGDTMSMRGYYTYGFINQTMRPIIEKNEGLFAHPYLDTVCKTTIGVGANIDKAELNEDWYYKDPKTKKLRHLDKNNPEDLALIKSELKKLQDFKDKLPRDEKGKPKNNYKAKYFEKITNLRISKEYLDELYYDRIKGAITDIKNTIKQYNNDPEKDYLIPDFEKLPQPLQIVLVDMMYNMGQPGFNYKKENGKGFPKFWDYLAKRNVDGMIKQSKRGGISKDRNDETANYLRQLRHFKHWKKPLE